MAIATRNECQYDLERIIGFYNTGLTLGLENDLAYFGSTDKFNLHIHNTISDHLGKEADNLVKEENIQKTLSSPPSKNEFLKSIQLLLFGFCIFLVTCKGGIYPKSFDF